MVLYTQEWYNGKGYPEGLIGEEIPLGGAYRRYFRCMGAMVSNRPEKGHEPTEANGGN